jgi:transcriptional regulator with XRE-family HTH domain
LLVTHTEGLEPEHQFGAHVREAREDRGWTQESLARRLRDLAGIDLHQTAIARLEVGKRSITLNEAAALAQLLGLDLGAYVDEASVGLSPEELARLAQGLEALQVQLFEAAKRYAELDEERRQMHERISALKRAEDMTLRRISAAQRRAAMQSDG